MAALLTSGLIPSLRPNWKFSRLSTAAKPPSFPSYFSTRLRNVSRSPPVSVLRTANGSASSAFVDADGDELEEDTGGGKYIREDYLVKKVSAKEVQALLKEKRSVPLVVDFYATWCGPCILMAQELEMLAVEYESNALFVKVDTDDEYEFARDMQVRGLPTLYFFSPDPNKDAIRTEGLVPPELIKNIIDNEL